MNYFAHALPFLEGDPYFLAGTAVPDWMSVADRRVRVRAKLAAPLIAATPDPHTRSVAAGALQHLHDDDWFHATRGFAEITGEVTRMFRELLGPADAMPCGFLGHIVTELLLDAALIQRHARELDRYYERLSEVDPRIVEASVNQMARGETRRLSLLIPLFQQERFLYDYAADAPLLARLNRVLERVKLHRLPASATKVLAVARGFIRDRTSELLPAGRYAAALNGKPTGTSMSAPCADQVIELRESTTGI